MDILASPAQKIIPPPDIWGTPFRRLTCWPTKFSVPSNGRRASSTSGLLAPAQTSAGRAACSCLPCPDVLPPLAMPSLYTHPHLLLFSGDGSLTPQSKQSTHVLPSAWETTANSSLAPCRSLPRPRRRPPPWCSRRGVVNERHASEVDCTWRG